MLLHERNSFVCKLLTIFRQHAYNNEKAVRAWGVLYPEGVPSPKARVRLRYFYCSLLQFEHNFSHSRIRFTEVRGLMSSNVSRLKRRTFPPIYNLL